MCLGVPGRVLEVREAEGLRRGRVAFGGVVKDVVLEYTPEAGVGDYVIVHVGFAIARVDEAEARRVFEVLRQLGDLSELGEEPPLPGSEEADATRR